MCKTRSAKIGWRPIGGFVALAGVMATQTAAGQADMTLEDSMTVAALAAGQAAEVMCSQVFLSGRDPADVLREELDGIALAPRGLYPRGTLADSESRSALSVSMYGEDRYSVMRPGLGCVLMPRHSTLDDTTSLPAIDLPSRKREAARLAWPEGDLLPNTPLPPEVDRQRLDAALEMAFTAEKYRPSLTTGVVVVYRGRIIAERYRAGWGAHIGYRTWSTAKSITSALVGIMVGAGKLDVEAPAPIPEWRGKGDPRGEITLANLLHMSSGLNTDGGGGPLTNQAYWGGVDTRALIARTPLEVEPGTRWKYANFDTMLLLSSVKTVMGDDQAFLRFPYEALFHRIGMWHTVMEPDPYGNFIGSSQVYTTARDLARLGLLYLHDGVWNGERILPEGWVAYSVTPAPTTTGAARPNGWGYGAQWWLFGEHVPNVPDDAFTSAGARGQFTTVVPSRDLVVVRRGLDRIRFEGGTNWDQAEFVADVLGAISERR